MRGWLEERRGRVCAIAPHARPAHTSTHQRACMSACVGAYARSHAAMQAGRREALPPTRRACPSTDAPRHTPALAPLRRAYASSRSMYDSSPTHAPVHSPRGLLAGGVGAGVEQLALVPELAPKLVALGVTQGRRRTVTHTVYMLVPIAAHQGSAGGAWIEMD